MSGTLSCRELVELVTEYLEGSLDGETRVRFDEHVSGCPGCTAYLEQMRQTVRLTGALPPESVSEPEFAELLAAFRDWRG